MKRQRISASRFIHVAAFVFIGLMSFTTLHAQRPAVHSEGRITLKNGTVIKAKNVSFSDSTVNFKASGRQSLPLSDVVMVRVRNGWGKGGLIFGSLAGAMVSGLGVRKALAEDNFHAGLVVAGVGVTALWGLYGHAAGSAFDHWQTVYLQGGKPYSFSAP